MSPSKLTRSWCKITHFIDIKSVFILRCNIPLFFSVNISKQKTNLHVPFLRRTKPNFNQSEKCQRKQTKREWILHKKRKKINTLRRKEFLLGLARKSISLFEVGSPVPQSVLTSFFFRKIGRCETLFALTPRDHVVGHRWCNGKLRCIFCFCLLLIRFDLFFALFCHLIESVWSGLCLLCFFSGLC